MAPKQSSLAKTIDTLFTLKDSENFKEILGKNLGGAVLSVIYQAKLADKELSILHDAMTELYNNDYANPIVKEALAKIEKLRS